MIENRKNNVMQKCAMDFIAFSGADVISTSGDRTHGQNDELSSFGMGGYFTSKNWYTSGHQD